MALSKPARPARIAPVVSTYSRCKPSRTVVFAMKLMSCPGPATNPSTDTAKCISTLPAADCGRRESCSVSVMALSYGDCGLQLVVDGSRSDSKVQPLAGRVADAARAAL